ncbi:tetratricopeptide repeat-containing protein [Planktothrix sp. FACHB-1355]|uniref:Tetratricopeptide repeat-containing protein n=1 Tax=Aerosakkonema funiforme FACHB-1375 TaxID=2949571 RepID=A0A926VL07_9CYAN|nr:tetratricopeptide repeat-containing protein [Aerosakkonema funiforme FACHB-1375]MBD3560088.1 tetratricopeptide repeat-containing protein [Planktothrix sp. FACHB-1355]
MVYNHLGQYEKAINYHQQALSITRSIGDRVRERNALGNLHYVRLHRERKNFGFHLCSSVVICFHLW